MSLAERGRTGAGLTLFSTLLWTVPLAVSARGSLALALALPLAVLAMAVVSPLVIRERALRANLGGDPWCRSRVIRERWLSGRCC